MDHAVAARDAPRICPFLHAATGDGTLGDPIPRPDKANRCTALLDAAPQSLRQQEYACLTSSHVNCPRFVRGVDLIDDAPATAANGLQLTPAIIGALLVLALSFALSVGFVVANGGMDLPVAPGSSAAAVVGSAAPSQAASPEPSAAEASVEPSVAPTSAPTSASTIAPTAQPTAVASVTAPTTTPTTTPSVTAPTTPRPSPPSPVPSSDRYALLDPCPDASDCWIYTIRSGDNLVSIARYFGVPLATVTDLNPWTKTTQLVAGQELRLPPPTR